MGSGIQKVLIVSDAQAAAGLSPAFLHQPAIHLLESKDQRQAVWIARQQRPDLIIEDLEGPHSAGVDLCRTLKTEPETAEIPLIMVASPAFDAKTLHPGPDVLIRKPIVQRQYFEIVRRFIPLPKRREGRHAVNLRFSWRDGDCIGQAFSRDISMYGAFLKTDRPFPSGTHLEVRFRLPGDSQEIRCGALVRQSVRVNGNGRKPGGFGVEFEAIHDADLERLQQYIRSHTNRSVFSFCIF